MKKIFLFILFYYIYILSFCQIKIVDLKANDTIIVDNSFLENLQILNPGFFYSDNSEIFKKNLTKSFFDQIVLTEDSIVNELLNDNVIKKKYEIYMKMAHYKFWHLILSRQNIESIRNSISEQDVFDYYVRNKEKFSIPCKYTFWQLWITDPNIKDRALKLFKKITRQKLDSKDFVPKNSEPKYTINIEFNLEIDKGNDLYNILIDAQLNKITGPIQLKNNREIYVFLVEKSGCGYRSFDEVKEICRTELSNKLFKEYDDSIQSEINKRFIIKGLQINEKY